MNAKINDFVFITILISSVIIYFSFYSLNVDSTWLLYCANEMLNDATLYVDLIIVNPPLMIIYSILPVIFSKLVSIPFASSYIFFVLILIAISMILSWSILKKYYLGKVDNLRYYLYGIGFILTVSISSDFGQREHLFMIFALPYILMMLYKDKINLSFFTIVFIAVFASLGFNIKPHFFLIFIGIELVYMLHCKKISSIFRVESLIIICSGFLYLLLIFMKFPEYIDFIIPLGMQTYAISSTKSYIYLLSQYDILLLILTIIFWISFTKRKIDFSIKIFFTLIISSLIIYLLQKKGWPYHRLPLFIIIELFLIHIIINLLEKKSKILAFAFVPIIFYILIVKIPVLHKLLELENIIQNQPSGSKIHVLSTDITRGQPMLVKKNQKWASRFPALFILNSAVNHNNESVKTYLFNALIEDIKKYEPDTIIFCGKYSSFDYYRYFSQNQQLKEIYDTYYTKSVIDGYTILSKRKDMNISTGL